MRRSERGRSGGEAEVKAEVRSIRPKTWGLQNLNGPKAYALAVCFYTDTGISIGIDWGLTEL